jgi:hypothetical protein
LGEEMKTFLLLVAAILGARVFQGLMYTIVHKLDEGLVNKEPTWRNKVVDALWWLA